MRIHCSLILLILATSACSEPGDSSVRADTTATPAPPSLADADTAWQVRALTAAPARFRPGGWSEESVLWGVVRGRVTRLDVETGATQTLDANAWSLHTARYRVSWRNQTGSWMLDSSGKPVRIAGPEPDSLTGFDGPPTVLWSTDGSKAVLGWHGEGGSRYVVYHADGVRQPVDVRMPGYAYHTPVFWLDSTRVLFQTVANAPLSGPPMHRESGWRGDLAVLDLRAKAFDRVTSVPDRTYLRFGSPYQNGVLVAEWDSSSVKQFWVYDPSNWQRRAIDLPKGRTFGSPTGAVVLLPDSPADTVDAVLVVGGKHIPIGRVARDTEPYFTPSGNRGALLTSAGVVLIERR